ncbi:TetR/AcrR family transcriptional regulator [Microvirga guangxiensis]|uniref:Transcriptional regulator, TetR family n=1 Tax=Microvirga guangxiensis TaxID=549386 RepID=A0A1G5BDL5_9HYPH|nr:TetR/AcrR family transcriptional regulator [Microvirga guangxiensis]SCX88265.1 transcriptional regulator, TetR family [Microvirga guangxiensis]
MSDLKDLARAEAVTANLSVVEEGAENAKRRQILEGARQVFLASGFDGASMGEIAKTAGVSKGTLYVYFDSKESLFAALTTEEKRSLAEVLFKLDAEDPDVRAVLTKLGETYIDHFSKPEHISSIRMVIGVAEKFPRLGQAFYEAGPCQGTARLAAYLKRQNEAGRLAIADTEVAAQHFLDLCQSGLIRRLLFSVGDPPTDGEIERNVANAIRVFFAAYGPQAKHTKA